MMSNIAVIGAGYWGKNLIRVFKELGVLRIICDIDRDKLATQSKMYPDIKTTDSVETIWEDKDIEAVVIATPASTHYELTKQALLCQKHVFVEKPLALKVKEGKQLLNLAKDSGKILMVAHILNYHPALIKLKEFINKGELGKIEHIYSNRLNIGLLRTEENILWSFAPHDISAILMLLEEEPVNVLASGGDYLNRGIFDITLTILEFKNGIKGHIFVSWLHPFKEQKLIVVGSKAMAVFDDLTKEKLFIYPHKIEWKNGKIPVACKAESYCIPVENKEPLKEEARHFLECILEEKIPKTDGEEGLRVLKVLEEAEKSIQNKNVSIRAIPDSSSIANIEADFGLESSVIAGKAKQSQQDKNYFVHQTSYIDDNVEIGEGTKIWHYSHILKNTKIGENCIVGQNVMIGPDVKIGNRCKIQNNVSLYRGVTLENEVFCGPSCVFTNVYTPRAFIERKNEFLPTLVKTGASIGANATIVCGVTIGRYSFIGAGAVVKKDVPDYGLVVGVPARQIGWVCKCAVTLKEFDESNIARCKNCGSSYKLQSDKLTVLEEMVWNEYQCLT